MGHMQMNTMLKLGSLALNVAQDDRVKELFTIVHKGAKRRGMIGAMPPMIPPQSGYSSIPATSPVSSASAVPFAPQAAAPKQRAGINQYLTAGNAKKVLGWASELSNLLIK
jgi:hypothetical protein